MSDLQDAADLVPQIESGGAPEGVEIPGGAPEGVEITGSVAAVITAGTGGADATVRVGEHVPAPAEGATAVGGDRVEQPLEDGVAGDRASQALQEVS